MNPEMIQDEQVLQPDGRLITGANIARTADLFGYGDVSPWTIGLQMRDDYIQTLPRDQTDQRVLIDTIESYRVNIFTVSPYIQNDTVDGLGPYGGWPAQRSLPV